MYFKAFDVSLSKDPKKYLDELIDKNVKNVNLRTDYDFLLNTVMVFLVVYT